MYAVLDMLDEKVFKLYVHKFVPLNIDSIYGVDKSIEI